MNTWWYIHITSLYQFFSRWTRDEIYISQVYINFSADEHVMRYRYRNFISTFLQMNTWWYIHTVTLYQLSWTRTRHDIYIPQVYINFLADEHLMIYTYRDCISTLLQMNTWWYIHTVTLYQLSCRRTREDIYIPELYINFPADEHVEIYTDCSVFSTSLQMNRCWYIDAATSCHFLFDEHVMIDFFAAALYQLSCR